MKMNYIFITNRAEMASICEVAGVDWVMVDLEVIGKEQRQKGRNTVISRHCIGDISIIKSTLKNAKVLVRCNPLNSGTKKEINQSIVAGADALMLPMFSDSADIHRFIDLVGGRAKVFLLAETIGAMKSLEMMNEFSGIDVVHIGLNDLSIQLKCEFMFEPLVNGVVERVAQTLRDSGIAFGVGGVAQLGEGLLPAEKILAEHFRLGSEYVILSRSFLNSGLDSNLEVIRSEFMFELKKIREYIGFLSTLPPEYFSLNHRMIEIIINSIKNLKKGI
jgi:2-keto-3-deoxy-L-rhamnonate aldolase RhmA